jgi:drug/metabolite transporter (DMT)-like permease
MKNITIIGIILIVLGVVVLIYGGISYVSSSNTVHMGDVNLKIEEKKNIPISPIAGAVAVVVGGVLILSGRRPRKGGSAL